MALFQDQVLGQRYVTVVEKLSTEDHNLLLHLNMDLPLSRLVKQIAMEFQAGEGFSRVPTGSDVDPTGHVLSLAPIEIAPRAYELKASGGGALNNGLSLHENGIKDSDTVELHLRS